MVYMVNWTAGGKWSRRLCGGSASPEEGRLQSVWDSLEDHSQL